MQSLKNGSINSRAGRNGIRMQSVSGAVLLLIFIHICPVVNSQSWEFIKEKDGIKIYTRQQENSSFLCFRGETVFHASLEQLDQYIGSVDNFNWWDKNIRDLKVLESESGRHAKYYFVYHVPWPLNDRDFCVEVYIEHDSVKGEKVVSAKPLPGLVPESEGIIRITDYWQVWTLNRIDTGSVRAVLEGFVDPGGTVPAWLYNMVIVNTPLKVMEGIKKKVEK